MQVFPVMGAGGSGAGGSGVGGTYGSSGYFSGLLASKMTVVIKTITRRMIVTIQHFLFLSSFLSLAACALSWKSEYLGALDYRA